MAFTTHAIAVKLVTVIAQVMLGAAPDAELHLAAAVAMILVVVAVVDAAAVINLLL